MLKRFLFAFLVATMWGCSSSGEPTTIAIENNNGESVGWAFAISDDEFVTADHIYQKHQPIFYSQRLIDITKRDTAQDLIYFRLPEEVLARARPAGWYKKALTTGTPLTWIGGSGEVLKYVPLVGIEGREYQDILVLTGSVQPGDSGLPVYNKKNQVVGLIMGGSLGEVYVRTLFYPQ